MMTSVRPRLQLASKSPRRAELLQQIGVEFAVVPGSIDESRLPSESVHDYVCRLAKEKAMQGFLAAPGLPTLGADTIVQWERQVFGKPSDKDDAMRMLSCLSGAWHTVISAVAIHDGNITRHSAVQTQVKFRDLTPEECERYWHTGEPKDKAGAYGIQGLAGVFVERIEGDYSAVVGLPLSETARLLAEFDIECWKNS